MLSHMQVLGSTLFKPVSKEDTVPVYKLTTSENGREMLFTNVGEVRRS